jgi:hypothetical protein
MSNHDSYSDSWLRYWLSRSVVSNYRHGVAGEVLAARLPQIIAKGASARVNRLYMRPSLHTRALYLYNRLI